MTGGSYATEVARRSASTAQAMLHANPSSSRATAAAATPPPLPRMMSRMYFLCSLSCARHAISLRSLVALRFAPHAERNPRIANCGPASFIMTTGIPHQFKVGTTGAAADPAAVDPASGKHKTAWRIDRGSDGLTIPLAKTSAQWYH